jgi:FKBP-type peptidyl-prolyl cis-trans isomerase FklB
MRYLLLATGLILAACGPAASKTEGSVVDRVPDPAASAADANLKAGEAFMTTNKSAAGIVTTASGLQYRVDKAGPANGAKPAPSSVVRVHYEGKLLDGTVFDSSLARGEPAEFPVAALIPAWVEALQLMRPGDEYTIWAPPGIAYGASGSGPIPPNSTLVFKMQLIAIIQGPGSEGGTSK